MKGFKSFPEKTELAFSPGVSVIVGPENAPPGTTVLEAQVRFENVPPGNYRLFAGKIDSGDGQALRVQVTGGSVTEVICFAEDTLITTARGDRPVQEMEVGDLVMTRDNGLQALRWTGRRQLCGETLTRQERLRPVRIAAGALGDGVPATDLMVSPQHRVLLRSRIANRMFGAAEVLCPAKHLLDLPGIEIVADLAGITYVHLLFDRNEVLFSNGAEAESLFTGPEAFRAVTAEQLAEILSILPDLPQGRDPVACCRPVITGKQGRKLVERHRRNSKPKVECPQALWLAQNGKAS